MNLKDRIMIERVSRLSELEPGEQEQVLRDPALQAALIENRLLGELSAAPPAPALEPTLEQALQGRESRENKPMSANRVEARPRFSLAAVAAAVVTVGICVVVVWTWWGTQLQRGLAPVEIPQSSLADGSQILDKPYHVGYHLPAITAVTSDGHNVVCNLSLKMTSYITAQDAQRYNNDLRMYEIKLEEYNRQLTLYNEQQLDNSRSARPTGMIFARSADYGDTGGRVVATKPVEPTAPVMPTTVLARAIAGEEAAVVEEITRLFSGFTAAEFDSAPDRRSISRQVRDLLNARYDDELGSIGQVIFHDIVTS